MQFAALDPTLVESNIPEEEDQGFFIGNAAAVIEILRNKMYNHPKQTLVQEYIANAKDACVEVGKDGSSVTIELPDIESMYLRITDEGPGLSPQRLTEVFMGFGSSTKRQDDSQAGSYGIGSKSAWSYTESFIIKNRYNGAESTYMAHIGKTRTGTLTRLVTAPWSGPNGVVIEIPIKAGDFQTFRAAVLRATMFWESSPKILELGEDANLRLNKLFEVPPHSGRPRVRVYGPNELVRHGIYADALGTPYFISSVGAAYENKPIIAVDCDAALLEPAPSRETYRNESYANMLVECVKDSFFHYFSQMAVDKGFKETVKFLKDSGVKSDFMFEGQTFRCNANGAHYLVIPDGVTLDLSSGSFRRHTFISRRFVDKYKRSEVVPGELEKETIAHLIWDRLSYSVPFPVARVNRFLREDNCSTLLIGTGPTFEAFAAALKSRPVPEYPKQKAAKPPPKTFSARFVGDRQEYIEDRRFPLDHPGPFVWADRYIYCSKSAWERKSGRYSDWEDFSSWNQLFQLTGRKEIFIGLSDSAQEKFGKDPRFIEFNEFLKIYKKSKHFLDLCAHFHDRQEGVKADKEIEARLRKIFPEFKSKNKNETIGSLLGSLSRHFLSEKVRGPVGTLLQEYPILRYICRGYGYDNEENEDIFRYLAFCKAMKQRQAWTPACGNLPSLEDVLL
jgi:hypothetical protein